MRIPKSALFLLIAAFLFSACSNDEKPAASAENRNTVSRLPEPLRYHKAVEVKPGLTLDVISWGRGSESVGGFLILRSDSTHLKYRSFSEELDGKIVDVWNMDMDSDGNPELFIQAQGEGEGSYLNMYVYEFSESGSAQELNFPNLSSASKKGYKGGDTLYVKDGKLIREFPVEITAEDTKANTTPARKQLEYGLRSNSFTVKEIEAAEDEN